MCGSCRAVVANRIEKEVAERNLKVQLLKKKWAKEKELKSQLLKEKKEAELRNIKLLCQQALRPQSNNNDRLTFDKKKHSILSTEINHCQIRTSCSKQSEDILQEGAPEQHDVYSECYDQHYLKSASFLGSASGEQCYSFSSVDKKLQLFYSISSDQNKPWLQPVNDRITLKVSMVV